MTDYPIDPALEIRVLQKTLAAAREHAHRARSENLDRDTCRFWQATCGWLRSRIRKLEAGEEPDWPDAMRQAPAVADMVDVVHPDGSHSYWSTHCRHGNHNACSATELAPGVPRRPAQCKTCAAPCRCPCGHGRPVGEATDLHVDAMFREAP